MTASRPVSFGLRQRSIKYSLGWSVIPKENLTFLITGAASAVAAAALTSE